MRRGQYRSPTPSLNGRHRRAQGTPLTTWPLAIHLLTSNKTNTAALELKRHLDVCYRTAWRLEHKIMQAMTEREAPRQLKGFVQMDDAYLGGEFNGGKPGRRSENKQAFAVAIETMRISSTRCAVIEPVKAFDNASIINWSQRRLAPDAEGFTDGLGAFRRFADTGHEHAVLISAGRRAAAQIYGARWVNVLLANVKRTISGTYHSIRQAKYARRYLGVAAYRFNRRFRLTELVPRLLRAMLLCSPCAEPLLRQATNFTRCPLRIGANQVDPCLVRF